MSLPIVVRESCVVAVDMWEYETSGQFQYADGLTSSVGDEIPSEDKAAQARHVGGGTGFERGAGIIA